MAAAARTAQAAWRRSGAGDAFAFRAPDAASDFGSAEIGEALAWVNATLRRLA